MNAAELAARAANLPRVEVQHDGNATYVMTREGATIRGYLSFPVGEDFVEFAKGEMTLNEVELLEERHGDGFAPTDMLDLACDWYMHADADLPGYPLRATHDHAAAAEILDGSWVSFPELEGAVISHGVKA